MTYETTAHSLHGDEEALADKERQRTSVRVWIGAGTCAVALGSLLWYLLAPHNDPHRGAILGLAVVAASHAGSWLHRCGNVREHRRLKRQNQSLLKRTEELQTSLDAKSLQHQRQMDEFTRRMDRRFAALCGQLDALLKQKSIGTAKIALGEAIAATIPITDAARHQYATESPTPADGLRLAWDSSKEN